MIAIGVPLNKGNGKSVSQVREFATKMNRVRVPELKREFAIYPKPTTNELNIKIKSFRLSIHHCYCNRARSKTR